MGLELLAHVEPRAIHVFSVSFDLGYLQAHDDGWMNGGRLVSGLVCVQQRLASYFSSRQPLVGFWMREEQE